MKILTDEEYHDWQDWLGYDPEWAPPTPEEAETPKEPECICRKVELMSGIWDKNCKYHNKG